MTWKSRLGRDEDQRKHKVKPEPTNNAQPTAMTEIVVLDKRGAEIVSVDLSLPDIQSEGEAMAGAHGDPLATMVELVLERIREAGAELSGSGLTSLRRELSKVAISGHPITTLELAGSRVGHTESTPAKTVPLTLPAELLEAVVYPNDRARKLYEGLIGLEEMQQRLLKEAIVLTQPQRVRSWARNVHGKADLRALATIDYGAPLIIFAGDVGVGKTALAESFGDAVARKIQKEVVLLRMSIQIRGSGIVGDMSKQITKAISAAEVEARRTGQVHILLLDEADALAESRETKQMHHEDRAGVNALIQGVDHLRGSGAPVLVVFCTNRVTSIDPAIRRRAVDICEFSRPNDAQRREHLERLLGDLGFVEEQWQELVDLTGPQARRAYGFTYSDIADRLVRTAIIDAFPDTSLSFEGVKRVAERIAPTRPFDTGGLA